MITEDVKKVLRRLKEFCEQQSWCTDSGCPFWQGGNCFAMIGKNSPLNWSKEITKGEEECFK